MSPIALDETVQVRGVAVIGAGPSGLAGARYLLAENKFSRVHVFEQRPAPGGVWNYTSTRHESGFHVPRTSPSEQPEQLTPVDAKDRHHRADSESASGIIVSPMYDDLETNIPHTLMRYTDLAFPKDISLFPHHSVVLKYIQDYAQDLLPFISFNAQVVHISKTRGQWDVETKDLATGQSHHEAFDAVLVGSGHYSDPFIPDIKGLAESSQARPESIIHSKHFRAPAEYVDKNVIVVGNSASGLDITAQLATCARLPILISEKQTTVAHPDFPRDGSSSRAIGEIVEFLPSQKAVRLADGKIERDIDAVIFCTGYHYSFPFLRDLKVPIERADGAYASHLWEHMLYTADPTLGFLAIPQRIVPFPIAEAQAAVMARIWSGRLAPPAISEMEAWTQRMVEEKGHSKAIHVLSTPKDVQYINRLFEMSMAASRRPGLENEGVGKIPPFWDAEMAWVRAQVPHIKKASRQLGEKRHEIRSLRQMGFDYEASLAETA